MLMYLFFKIKSVLYNLLLFLKCMKCVIVSLFYFNLLELFIPIG